MAVFVCAMANDCSVFFTPLLFLAHFLILGQTHLISSMGIVALFYMALRWIFIKYKGNKSFIFSAFSLIAFIGYIFLNGNGVSTPLDKKLIVIVATTLLCFLCCVSISAITKKKLKYKFGFEEYASIIAVTVAVGLGVCNFISPYFWKGFCGLIVMFFSFLFGVGASSILSAVFGMSFAVYYGNLSFISVFLVWGIVCGALMSYNKYLSCIALPIADLVVQLIFNIYGVYQLPDFLPLIIASLIFMIIPQKLLKKFKAKILSFQEKQLVRQTINRNKLMVSNRLFELSNVFTEMKVAFNAFKKNELSQDTAKKLIEKQTTSCLCDKCDKNTKCIQNRQLRHQAINKMIDIGFAKGKLTLIDMPSSLGDICLRPSDMLYSVNKLLADYRSYCIDKKNASIGRELLAEEAEGVAEILKGLALETGAMLNFQNVYEKALSEALFKNGYTVSELLIHGEKERLFISMILNMKEFSLPNLQAIISRCMGQDMILCDKNNLSVDKCYLVFRKQPPFDAVFGVAKTTKEGSNKSGDTHSVMKLSGDKFMVALSDGMGSGDNAEKISSVAISLIESFYKAGLSGNLILSTVNKLLAINSEDTFTALDISVIDLKTCQADFIKYGSPYGFIIGENGIRIIEGNTLPLGILDELKPSVCQADLSGDNMVLLVTDGVSDAFGSSGEIIDFIRSVPALNPQTLADSIVAKAIELNDGKPKDDMTALAVRLFKKQKAI